MTMSLPPTRIPAWGRFPSPDRLQRERRERGFIQGGEAHVTIPPYNAQRDPHIRHYFHTPTVQAVLRRTGQDNGGTSASGWVADYQHFHGSAQRYLSQRNQTGLSAALICGHSSFLSDVRPMNGYNGRFGYRRNVPSLRTKPSSFGQVSVFSLH
ncbi:sperm microtubule associated protein 1-like [Ascaphus truei]|uniref:sperm microtubule associated protein 1-like n=1 Tax=Ascaphus truei TaxID=8439 RepID=UPI003F5A8001